QAVDGVLRPAGVVVGLDAGESTAEDVWAAWEGIGAPSSGLLPHAQVGALLQLPERPPGRGGASATDAVEWLAKLQRQNELGDEFADGLRPLDVRERRRLRQGRLRERERCANAEGGRLDSATRRSHSSVSSISAGDRRGTIEPVHVVRSPSKRKKSGSLRSLPTYRSTDSPAALLTTASAPRCAALTVTHFTRRATAGS